MDHLLAGMSIEEQRARGRPDAINRTQPLDVRHSWHAGVPIQASTGRWANSQAAAQELNADVDGIADFLAYGGLNIPQVSVLASSDESKVRRPLMKTQQPSEQSGLCPPLPRRFTCLNSRPTGKTGRSVVAETLDVSSSRIVWNRADAQITEVLVAPSIPWRQ